MAAAATRPAAAAPTRPRGARLQLSGLWLRLRLRLEEPDVHEAELPLEWDTGLLRLRLRLRLVSEDRSRPRLQLQLLELLLALPLPLQLLRLLKLLPRPPLRLRPRLSGLLLPRRQVPRGADGRRHCQRHRSRPYARPLSQAAADSNDAASVGPPPSVRSASAARAPYAACGS